jgi:anti-sigma-K factor RskA
MWCDGSVPRSSLLNSIGSSRRLLASSSIIECPVSQKEALTQDDAASTTVVLGLDLWRTIIVGAAILVVLFTFVVASCILCRRRHKNAAVAPLKPVGSSGVHTHLLRCTS